MLLRRYHGRMSAEADTQVDFDKLTKAELEAIAKERGLQTNGKTKAQIIALLEGAG